MLELTAQLSKRDAANYQIKFEKNSINALSCSTTFEMGVDVGELETVLMRDVPPSASNYVQRAGRAGRSVDSSAFVVTFAKLSSHDFTFFDEPTKMINGKILPPIFKIDNDHIVMRQIFSVVFGFFFNKYSDYYLDEDEKTKSIIDLVSKQGLIDLKNLLCVDDDMRRELSQELKRAFTSNNLDEIYNISNFRGEWVNNLISGIDSVIDYLIDKGRNQQEAVDIYNYLNPNVKYGRYVSALIDYYHTLFIYEDKIVNEDDEEKKNAIDQKRLFFKKQEIIKFLVSSNILPKYGFPVDTVDLKVNPSAYTNADNNDTLRLTRDLSQAISDYAPGSKVIANDRMYTSRYILKYVKDGKRDFEKRYIAKCANDNCNTMNCKTLKPEQNVKCIGCGEWISHSKFIEAIYPAAGMAMENKTGERVPLNRPQKVYKTDYYFVEEEMERNSKTIDFGEKQIVIISSQKDTIGISSNLERPFYVCQRCGFSYGINDANRIKDEDNKPDKKAIDVLRGKRKSIYMECAKKHMNPYGKACSNTVLTQNALYHSYHTDIVQIIFKNDSLTLRDSYKTALSVLYALLDAISNVLDIERDEISGVLVKCTNSLFGNNYKFILFDTVPGGAGHVKQLSGDNLDNIHKIFEYAYNKTHDCSCGEDSSCYGCLRTYENQKYHDQLSRKSAYSFLQHYLDYPILHEEYVVNVDATDQNKNDYSWEDLFDTFDFDFTQSLKEILKQLPVPSHMYCDASINNYNLNSPIALYWSDFNVLIIERSKYDLIEEESVKNYIKNGFPESKIFVEGIGIENDKLKKLLERGE